MGIFEKLFTNLLLIGLFFPTTATVLAEETVRLANGEWPPYTSKEMDHYGVYSHIVSEAFALEGVKVEYGFFPWARSYLNVVDGAWDGSLTWALTPDKEAEVLFSGPVFTHEKVFFHLKNFAFDWTTIEQLAAVRIGATRKYTYGDKFDEAAKDGIIKVAYVTSDIQNLKKLLAGRIDVFPSDITVGYDLLNTSFTPEQVSLITHHPKPIQVTHTGVIFTKKNPEKSQRLLKLFNSGLEKLKASGRFDELLKASRQGEYRADKPLL